MYLNLIVFGVFNVVDHQFKKENIFFFFSKSVLKIFNFDLTIFNRLFGQDANDINKCLFGSVPTTINSLKLKLKYIFYYVNWLINKFNEMPITAEVVLLELSILTLFQKNPMASYIPVPTIQTVHSEVIVPTVLTLVQFMDIILDITRRTDCQL